jgi:FixJ family two-component response regulator
VSRKFFFLTVTFLPQVWAKERRASIDMNSYQFRMEQELDPRIAWIPIVLMTADGDIQAKKYKIGAKTYISKPVEVDAILEAVQRFSV